MIFYFSGTGNSRWVAEQMAERIGDTAHDIMEVKEIPDVASERQIGLVFPIYAWGAPEPMIQWVQHLPRTKGFVFALGTCGEEAGKGLKKLSKVYPLDSAYSLIMPNNYILGSDVEDTASILRKLEAAKVQIEKISAEVLDQKKVYRVHEGSKALLKSSIVNWGFNHFARDTRPFTVRETCNGCGICAQRCPASTITLLNGRPSWGKHCFQCLRCINECPQKAIDYGKDTQNRGRYRLKAYLQLNNDE